MLLNLLKFNFLYWEIHLSKYIKQIDRGMTSPKSGVGSTQYTEHTYFRYFIEMIGSILKYFTEIHSAASAGSPGSGGGVAACLPATTVHSAPPTSAGTAS